MEVFSVPSKDSLRLVHAMVDQVMGLHPNIKNFHIGCDEVSGILHTGIIKLVFVHSHVYHAFFPDAASGQSKQLKGCHLRTQDKFMGAPVSSFLKRILG